MSLYQPGQADTELAAFLEGCLRAYCEPTGTAFDGMVSGEIAQWIAARLEQREQVPLTVP